MDALLVWNRWLSSGQEPPAMGTAKGKARRGGCRTNRDMAGTPTRRGGSPVGG